MHSTNRIDTILWLALLLACAAGGWHFGTSVHAPSPESAAEPSLSSVQAPRGKSTPSVFPGASRRASWIERVKAAKPGEFPALVAGWKEQFPEDERYEGGRAPNAWAALQWLHGMWLVKDPDGFFRALGDDPGEGTIYPVSAAIAMVELMPEKAVALFTEQDSRKYNSSYFKEILSELALKHPELYLQLDPTGELGLYYDRSGRSENWFVAITNLAKTDAPAAGNACVQGHWRYETLFEGFKAVATAWQPGDPDIVAWTNAIQDPNVRRLAHDARLTVLAERDPMSALAELSTTETKHLSNFAKAKVTVLRSLASKDPKAALKLMADAEDYFFPGGYIEPQETDPFAPAPDSQDPGTNALLSAFHKVDPWGPVLSSISATLPDEPAEFFAAIRQLTADLKRDASWQKRVEATLIHSKIFDWSAEQCLGIAKQWVTDYQVTAGDEILRNLARMAVQNDPKKAPANLEDFPGAMQPAFRYEIIKALPSSEREQRMQLLKQLPIEYWDSALGENLGKNAEDYAAMVATLPPDKSQDLLSSFIETWTNTDPEMVAQWLQTLSDPAASAEATQKLAYRWFNQDADGAAAWVNTLPEGASRDAAVASIVSQQAQDDPTDAWRWADTIADARMQVEAYDKIANHWEGKWLPSPEFEKAHREARQQIGLPAYQKPVEEDPFR